MTTETKCLPGCVPSFGLHDLGCPKAEASNGIADVQATTPAPEPKRCASSRCDGEKHWLGDQAFACPNVCRCTDKPGPHSHDPEPKQESEEPIGWEAEEVQMLEDFGPPDHDAAYRDAANIVKNYEPQECTDEDLNNSRAYLALRAENFQLKEQAIEDVRAMATLETLAKTLRAENEKLKAHFIEQWTLEETRFLETLHRAQRSEERVRDLENFIVDWETEPQYRVTNLNMLHRVARDILANRAKGEGR